MERAKSTGSEGETERRSERRHNACGPPCVGRRAGRDQDDDSILSETSGSIDQWRDRCLLGPDRSSTYLRGTLGRTSIFHPAGGDDHERPRASFSLDKPYRTRYWNWSAGKTPFFSHFLFIRFFARKNFG